MQKCDADGIGIFVPLREAATENGKTVKFAFVKDPMGNALEIVEGMPGIEAMIMSKQCNARKQCSSTQYRLRKDTVIS